MSIELYLLLASTVLLLVYLSAQTFLRKAEVGIEYDVGPRDGDQGVQGLYQGRAERAFHNMLETYPVFVALVVVVELGDVSNPITQWGAAFYLGFRVIYLPLYLFGVRWLRTFSWNIATSGLAAMIVGVLV